MMNNPWLPYPSPFYSSFSIPRHLLNWREKRAAIPVVPLWLFSPLVAPAMDIHHIQLNFYRNLIDFCVPCTFTEYCHTPIFIIIFSLYTILFFNSDTSLCWENFITWIQYRAIHEPCHISKKRILNYSTPVPSLIHHSYFVLNMSAEGDCYDNLDRSILDYLSSDEKHSKIASVRESSPSPCKHSEIRRERV